MDKARAHRMARELSDRSLGGWLLDRLIDAGKSALVFAAKKDGQTAAVKVFDPELVERFGLASQLERIQRELELRTHEHPNLVRILDGGHCEDTDLLYVAMELLEWPPLQEIVGELPRDRIWPLLEQVASAARYLLEEFGAAHRDIKPSNIVVDPEFTSAKLLDLGVLRPIGSSDLTDEDSRPFIGTLRYSSPEFLLRKEEDSIEGWKAVTFYQLGAVLHDMIMRKPLFEAFSEPYAQLVHAVTQEKPNIEAADVDPDLVVLARSCLTKEPGLRLRLVSWESFERPLDQSARTSQIKQRLRQRQQQAKASQIDDFTAEERNAREKLRAANEMLGEIERTARRICTNSTLLPPALYVSSPVPHDGYGTLHISFDASERYALSTAVSILLVVKILDTAERAVTVSGVASLSSSISIEDVPEGATVDLYEGVYEKSIVKDNLDLFFHEMVDLAQRTPTSDSTGDVEVIFLTRREAP